MASDAKRYTGRLTLVSLAAVSLVVGGCVMTDSPTETGDGTAPVSPNAESETSSSVRLPSIRLSRRSVVPIDSLMADREADTVAVSGTVTQRSAVLSGWLYEVKDETGSLWVLTERSEPAVGAIATVEGIVRYEPIVVGEIDAGSIYLEEQAYESEEPN
ncbi:MAG: hypothetical protein AAF810_02770 [Cyanobacteria bacterium P01_D01_bin.36]